MEAADRQSCGGSRGKSLQPRTQEIFDDLGVMDALRDVGGPFPPMQTWRDGRRDGEWQLVERDPRAPASRYPDPWLVPQWRTQEILRDRLEASGTAVQYGTRLTSLRQTDRHVRAELTHADGSRRTLTVPFLVGADGGHSTVREELGVTMKDSGEDLHAAIVADVRVRGLDRDHWHIWPDGPGGGLLLCPLPGTDYFRLNARPMDEDSDLTPRRVRALVAARTHLSADAVIDVPWSSYYRPRTALAECFRKGRVFLAGDAAHIHSPGGGQGLNIGVQDAYNLGWKLGQVLRHHAPEALLDSYDAERRPAAADVLELSSLLYRLGRGPQGNSARTRHRARLTLLLVHYRDSPLSTEARERLTATTVQAGDRAPDLKGAFMEGTTAHDTLRHLSELIKGPHFTLLAVNDPPPRMPQAVRTLRVTGGALAQALGAGLFLIRPDGHIGLATRDPAHLERYLAKVHRTD